MPSDPLLTRRQALGLGLGAGAAALGAGALVRPGGWATAAAASPLIQLRVDPSTAVGSLPATAMGLSFEKATLGIPLFAADNAPLVALFRLLGPGVLRLGGNSVERTTWDPTGPGLVAGTVAPADLVRLTGFAEAVGWPVIYGTPFVHATVDAVADEAAAATAQLGRRLAALELCNEPDLYVLDPTAAAVAGTFAQFRARWEQLAHAIEVAAPGAALSGPATCLLQTVGTWTTPFASAEAGRIGLLTQHYYRGFGGTETIDELLADDPLLDATLPVLAASAQDAGVGYRLGETNSFANGGAPGVSNTLASALWGTGLVLGAAAGGAQGVNLHTSGAGAGYPPFVQVGGTVTEIRPLFYGLLLAAGAGPGDLVAADLTGAPATLRAWAVRRGDATVGVVLVNTDPELAATVSVELPGSVWAATASDLAGPSLAATRGVTFQGAAVDASGGWDPTPPRNLVVDDGRVTVSVGAAGATLVAITPAPPTSSSTSTTAADPATTSAAGPTGTPMPAATPVNAAPRLTG